jgi:gliding motility-associated-like protein
MDLKPPLKFIVVFLFLKFQFFSLKSQECTPFSVPYPNMGINIPNPVDLPWVNLWNQVNPWHSGFFSSPKTGSDLELGPDGWPVAGKSHRVVIGEDMSVIITIPADTIKVSYKGTVSQFSETDGNCTIVPGTQRDNYPKAGYAFLKVKLAAPVVPITEPGNHAIYAFVFNGHVEDIKIMRPGFNVDDNALIHPDYMNLLNRFSTLRFMPFLATNNYQVNNEWECVGPLSVDWKQRWNPNSPQACSGNKGGSWEVIVELCNQFDKDMWINVPVVASDEYVTQLAQMIRQKLKPGLNVNIEIGNETWNWGGGFCCSRQIEAMCGEGNGNCHMIWQANRLKQVIEIFAGAWGWNEINNRIRGILCGQIGYGLAFYDLGWTIQNGLEYIRNTYHENPGKYFYAVGAAPYFGTQGDFSSVDNIINACRTDIDDNTFGEYSNELWNGIRTGNKFDGWAKLAFECGMKIYCYEGGPDMDYTTGSTVNKAFAMRDPRMTDLCIDYWTKWYSRYGYNSLFCFFLSTFGNSGLYTLSESFYTTSTRQTAINSIVTNPAPPFDMSRNIVDPVSGVLIDCRKIVAYREDWQTAHNGDYLHPGTELNYFIAAKQNGRFSISIEHNCAFNSSVDIYLDSTLIASNVQLPTTSTVYGDWAFATYRWTADQGVNIQFDMTYGVHLLKIHCNNENGSYRYIRANMISQHPPSMPAPIQGDISACLGNPHASYTVDLDGSACQYEWDVTGGSILPPAGGDGAAVSGQGTNLIYVNWNGLPAGDYQIRVRAINGVGTSTWQSAIISLASCGFTANPNPACINSEITFTPDVSGNITNWSWNFGAGAVPTTSDVQNPPPVSYSYAGNKSVQLTVTYADGTSNTFVNEVIVGHTIAGAAIAAPAIVDAGGSAGINLTGQEGSVVNWEYSMDNNVWIPISTVQLPLNTGPLASSTWYRAIVQANGCNAEASLPVQVIVNNPVNSGEISPAISTICSGTTGPLLTLSGNDGSIVRWESKQALGDWVSISGASGNTYTPLNVTSTTSYRVIVNIGGIEYPSQMATVSISGSMSAGIASANSLQVCPNGSPTLFLSNASGDIQWQQSPNGYFEWTDIPGATSATYTTEPLTNEVFFRANQSGGSCPTVTSNILHITINSSVQPGYITGNRDFCSNNAPPQLTLRDYTATSLQWEESGNGLSFSPVTNATLSNYTPASYTGTKYFRVMVTQSGCPAIYSDTVQMSSIPVPSFTLSSTNPVSCSTPDGSIQLSGLTENTSYAVSYYNGLSMTGPANFTSDGSGTIQIRNLAAGSYSNFSVTCNGCSTSNSATLTLQNPSNISITDVLFINPVTCRSSGTIMIVMSGANDGDSYNIDYDNNGATDASGFVAKDTIKLSGIPVHTTISNLVITNTSTGCRITSARTGTINSPVVPSIVNVICISPAQCGGTGIIKISINNGTNGERYSVDYDGNGTADNSGILANDTITLSGIAVGVSISHLTITGTTSGCTASGDFPGHIMDHIPLQIDRIKYTAPVVCNGYGILQIILTGATSGHVYNVSLNSGNSNISLSSNDDTLRINDLTIGTHVSTITVTDVSTNCNASSFQNITVYKPSPPDVHLSEFNTICTIAPVQPLNQGMPQGGNYTIDDAPATEINPEILGAGNHSIIYTYTDSRNCVNSDTAQLLIDVPPDANILGEQNLCPQAQNVIYSDVYNNNYNYSWQVTGGTYTQGNNPAQIAVNWNNTSGSVQLSVTNTADHCTSSSAIQINFSDAGEPMITNCLGDYRVKASVDGNNTYYVFTSADSVCIPKATDRCNLPLSYSFTADNEFHNMSDFTGFRINKNEQNTIRWIVTNSSGNFSECIVNILFDVGKKPPTAFSPNGDQHNDTWEMDFLVNYPECVVKVYNRWGMLVYESEKGYPAPWNGESKGRLVPVDTYYYIITTGNSEKDMKGIITVLY